MEQINTLWGYFITLSRYNNSVMKKLIIYPGQAISYQYHNNRNEIWNIISGVGNITLDGIDWRCVPDDIIYIKCTQKHRVRNIGTSNLVIHEMQFGELCSEDDIVRLQDDYGRCDETKL